MRTENKSKGSAVMTKLKIRLFIFLFALLVTSAATVAVVRELPIQQNAPIMWYIGRMSGVAAFIMFTLVVCMGLTMTSRILLKFPVFGTPTALEAHSFNATFIGFSLVVVHFVSFMFDDAIRLKLSDVLIPFTVQRDLNYAIGWKLGFPISLGIIAFYLMLILVVTSRLRKKVVPLKIWRLTHYSSFLFYVTFLAHGFLAGTDSKEGWMQAIYIASVSAVGTLLLLRIFGKKYFLPTLKSVPVPQANKIEEIKTLNA